MTMKNGEYCPDCGVPYKFCTHGKQLEEGEKRQMELWEDHTKGPYATEDAPDGYAKECFSVPPVLSDEKVAEIFNKDPLNEQVGGNHYKDFKIQPIEYITANDLSWCEGNVVKYISRHAKKHGVEDLKKVIHYARLAAKLDYGEDI